MHFNGQLGCPFFYPNIADWEAYMTADKLSRFWLLVASYLIVIVFISSFIIWKRYDKGTPLEISYPPSPVFQGELYLDGAVIHPGTYPLKSDDSLYMMIQASGGTTPNADLSRLHLHIPAIEETQTVQKVDINRAEEWLLIALPDIGETRAQAIIQYRQQNGRFRNIEEITLVPGISDSTYLKIKDFITVTE